ncbi:unnamed protein product [Sphenostylis stenocarpa]|uniref:Uncharacterized protein n=1 Tax=Sphenostylis stenocarpa TaxID=92480 RepID=A0AA86V8J4_9FABA|nr:unnamed protein product [Sphenostylis stenocarpa]
MGLSDRACLNFSSLEQEISTDAFVKQADIEEMREKEECRRGSVYSKRQGPRVALNALKA